MKKWFAILLAALLMMGAAGAEDTSFDMNSLAGKGFLFSSGVGAWYTELRFGENGTFTGVYHDSDMGDTGKDYPNGTVYECLFHGTLEAGEPISEYGRKLHVKELAIDAGQKESRFEDGIRYLLSGMYGLEGADTLVLYAPATPVYAIPEESRFWLHLEEGQDKTLDWALLNPEDGSLFICDGDLIEEPTTAPAEDGTPQNG